MKNLLVDKPMVGYTPNERKGDLKSTSLWILSNEESGIKQLL